MDTKSNLIIVGNFVSFFKTSVFATYLIIYYKLFRVCRNFKACTELQRVLAYSGRSKAGAWSNLKLVVTKVINGRKLWKTHTDNAFLDVSFPVTLIEINFSIVLCSWIFSQECYKNFFLCSKIRRFMVEYIYGTFKKYLLRNIHRT